MKEIEVCDFRYDEGLRTRVEKTILPTITTKNGGGISGMPMLIEKEKKPRKDIKQAERYCKYCGEKLKRKRFNGRLEDYNVFLKRPYCNRECMKKDYLKIGNNHNQNYSSSHTTARKINELILKKDECEICGEREKKLDIHHIDGNWQNNNLDNLMCLCRSCHMKLEADNRKRGDLANLRIRKLTPNECWRSSDGFL